MAEQEYQTVYWEECSAFERRSKNKMIARKKACLHTKIDKDSVVITLPGEFQVSEASYLKN